MYKDNIDLVTMFGIIDDIQTKWPGIGFAILSGLIAIFPRV